MLINLLNTGKKFSINELARELEVSERMVRSYKQDLELAGIYITGIKGPYGGYVLDRKVIVPAIKVGANDIELLERTNNKEFFDLINKLKLIVSEYDQNKIDTSSDKFTCFQKAIKEQLKVKILYDSPTDGIGERVIHPMEMPLFTNGWYIVGYCEKRKDMRTLVFDRVLNFEISKENF